MKAITKIFLVYLLLISLILFLGSCRSTRGYEHCTKNFIGYGTYKAPNKKGLDK